MDLNDIINKKKKEFGNTKLISVKEINDIKKKEYIKDNEFKNIKKIENKLIDKQEIIDDLLKKRNIDINNLKKEDEENNKLLEIDNFEEKFKIDDLNKFIEHNNLFKEKLIKLELYKRRKHDLSINFNYEEIKFDLIIWIKYVYNKWKNHISLKYSKVDLNTQEKKYIKHFEESKYFLNLFINLLNNNEICPNILRNFFHCIHFNFLKKFVFSLDNYIDISVGNNAWPIGIAKTILQDKPINPKIYIPKSKSNLIRLFKRWSL